MLMIDVHLFWGNLIAADPLRRTAQDLEASAQDLERAKAALVLQSNTDNGLPTTAPFHSGNCCVATR